MEKRIGGKNKNGKVAGGKKTFATYPGHQKEIPERASGQTLK